MTKKEIEKLLKKSGFEKRSGKKHDIWIKDGFPPIPIPRHKGDIPVGTAKKYSESSRVMRFEIKREINEILLCDF